MSRAREAAAGPFGLAAEQSGPSSWRALEMECGPTRQPGPTQAEGEALTSFYASRDCAKVVGFTKEAGSTSCFLGAERRKQQRENLAALHMLGSMKPSHDLVSYV